MSRNTIFFIRDIQTSCQKILTYADGLTRDSFFDQGIAYDAIVRHIFIIGEATKQIPREIKEQFPDMPWRSMARMRDVLAHRYFRLDDYTLWAVVETEIPRLLVYVEKMLKMLDKG